MNNKSHVAMEYAICPICGEEHATGIVLDKRLRDSLPPKITTHYDLCDKCKDKIKEGYVALIEARDMKPEEKKFKIYEPNRTGRMIWIRKSASTKLFKGLEVEDIAFIDVDVYEKLHEMYMESTEGGDDQE